jgi:hypothetical protein
MPGFPENPILIDINCEKWDTESEPGSAQCPILIEYLDALPESEETSIEPVTIARGASHSIDATLTDGMDLGGDIFEGERRTMF